MKEEHLSKLLDGAMAWNQWRRENPTVEPALSAASLRDQDLAGCNLRGADLYLADLSGSDLSTADLSEAYCHQAELAECSLRGATLTGTDLSGAVLRGADLTGAYAPGVNLSSADLHQSLICGCYLVEARLIGAQLIGTDLTDTDLTNADLTHLHAVDACFDGVEMSGARIYGLSAWNVSLERTIQRDLVVTPPNQPLVSVDNLEIAQFVYLMLHSRRLRNALQTLTTKVVLILGRFTPPRKEVLDALREVLRCDDYLPILFDFEALETRDTTETIVTLAGLARFVIADLSDPRCVQHELAHIVPHFPSLPVMPLLLEGEQPYAMFDHWLRYPWVLPIHTYRDLNDLMSVFHEQVVKTAEAKAVELQLH